MADETPAVKPRRLHPNPLAVWTACLKTPQRFSDLDGRLPQPNGGDLPIGQDGWSVAFDFSNFADLADKLSGGTFNMPSHVCGNALFSCPPLEQNQVFRLAITVHGAPGVADVDGVFASAAAANVATQDDDRFLNVATLKSGKFDASLSKIEQCFHDNTIVFLMGCRIAAGVEGNTFLQALSQRWDGVRVAAISTIGFSDGARQAKFASQGSASYPGMRDTRFTNHKVQGGPTRDFETLAVWNDLKRLPWAGERSPHVKIAFRGVLIKRTPEPVGVFGTDG
ncbi:MAG TPA: hypothetical protein VER12_03660 [Polyangiaceae bacterium]|nr:hypothetical protein [Polyangiaceae bacterium]